MNRWLPLLLLLLLAGPAPAAEQPADATPSPSLQPITDVAGLPRVLLIGDSVSLGYTLRVRSALQGRANVHRVPANAGPSSKGVAELARWLGDGRWDVIHFNFGLHDVRLLQPGVRAVPPAQYEANLRAIVARLRRTGAKLVWATTTPVPAQPRPGQYPRNPDDIAAYNAIAARVMAEHGVRSNDLYAAVLPRISELQPPGDVHFNAAGSDVLAARVAAAIAAVLPPGPAAAAPAATGSAFTVVRSLAELRAHLDRDGARVRLAPGTYRLEDATTENFLHFTGRDSHFDFTGVRLEVPTAQFARFRGGLNLLLLSGDHIVLEGLELETLGHTAPRGGCRALSLLGRGVVVRNVSLRLSGSYPYGYGSFFGIGAGAALNPQKQNGIRVGGIDNQVLGCRIVMRCFGHALFLRGAQNALVKDCVVEGALRKTDDILAETSGPAFEQRFRQYTGHPIPPGAMTSLSEDGIRAYPNDPETGRRTQDIRVENCRVTRMRRGICLAYASGRNTIVGCEVTESERVAYHVQSATTVRDCRGDAVYSQVLDISSAGSQGSTVELTVLDSRSAYGHAVLATVNGAGHRVTLTEAVPGAVPRPLTIDVAQARSAPGAAPEPSRASRVELVNRTGATVVLHAEAREVSLTSAGPVTDRGAGNRVHPPPASAGRDPGAAEPPFTRVPVGRAVVSLPAPWRTLGPEIPLWLHLHGATATVEREFATFGAPGVLVTLTLPGLSKVYADHFADPAAFGQLLRDVAAVLRQAAPGTEWELGRLTVSSFSAGFGGVRQLLRQPEAAERISVLVMADSIYCGYAGDPRERRVDPELMEGFVRFARRAADGTRRLLVTHSQQVPEGYASTTETADYLLARVGGTRAPRDHAWKAGLRELSHFSRGGLEIIGFAGDQPDDHLEHLRSLGFFLARMR